MNKAVNFAALTPNLFLERALISFSKKTAIINNSKKISYENLYKEAISLATKFNHVINKNDKIAYICDNSYEMLLGFLSVPLCGAVIVPINTRLEEKIILEILKHSDTKVLVIEEKYFKKCYSSIVEKVIVINGKEEYSSYSNFIKNAKSKDLTYNCNENDTFSINYTSGTTGNPKGVEYSHRSLYLNALGECLHNRISIETNYLWVLPMFHCNGWCFPWALIASGGTQIFCKNLKPSMIIDKVLEKKITHFCAAPTVLTMIEKTNNLSKLKDINLSITTAGSTPSVSIIKKYLENNIKIIHVYGLTETLGPHTFCEIKKEWKDLSIDELAKKISSQGIPTVHGQTISVIDENNNPIKKNGKAIGEAVMKGNNVMKGYYKDKKSTKIAFKDGFFHSGDLASINNEGYLEIKDRKKDIIISGGEKIPSILLEKVIQNHKEVAFVAVIPCYDETWGEAPHAIIETKDKNTINVKEIIDLCKKELPKYMRPKKISFDTLPKTITGKIQKTELRKKYKFCHAL